MQSLLGASPLGVGVVRVGPTTGLAVGDDWAGEHAFLKSGDGVVVASDWWSFVHSLDDD